MGLMVLESEGIADGDLPVTELATQMRLADGYETVPGQAARLRQRLRAAIISLERRLGKALLRREFVLGGAVPGGADIRLPLAPIWSVAGVETLDGGGGEALPDASLHGEQMQPCLDLGRVVPHGTYIRLSTQAGWDSWSEVPCALAEAVLMMAEALDTGDGPAVNATVDALVAPWKPVRLGRAR